MKKLLLFVGLVVLLVILLAINSVFQKNKAPQMEDTATTVPVEVTPISHATAILSWDNSVIYTDPVGGAAAFNNRPRANIILVTDIHPDHLSTSTLHDVLGDSTLIVPQAVKDLLPADLKAKAKVMKNGDTVTEQGFTITAIPMYNLPATSTAPHTKGRGNGYIVEKDGYRVYIAGDTSGTPEMRSLKDIDMAFIPMNLPYTMTVEEAADAVLSFKPHIVYPYHYRGQDGLSDINKFKEIVNAGDSSIDVRLLNWYPEQ